MLLALTGGGVTGVALPDAAPAPELSDMDTASLSAASDSKYTHVISVGGSGETIGIRIHYSLFTNAPDAGALQAVVIGQANGTATAATGVDVRYQPTQDPTALLTTPVGSFDVSSMWRLNLSVLDITGQGSASPASGGALPMNKTAAGQTPQQDMTDRRLPTSISRVAS